MAVAAGSIVYDGNGAAVRDWVNTHPKRPPYETWFITKGMTADSGGQAWRYIKDSRAWPEAVTAAVYDPRRGEWLPVRRGDTVRRAGAGFRVIARGA